MNLLKKTQVPIGSQQKVVVDQKGHPVHGWYISSLAGVFVYLDINNITQNLDQNLLASTVHLRSLCEGGGPAQHCSPA